jgi:transcriptional regulator with XRE-family HTH domain
MTKDRTELGAGDAVPGIVPEFGQGDRLRKARELTGLGIRDFATRIGVSHQTVTNAEKGHRTVRRITLNAWAFHSGVSALWLETGSTSTDEGN